MPQSFALTGTAQACGKGGDEALGRSTGELSTKLHTAVDALGNPTGFTLTPGQASDLAGADVLVPLRQVSKTAVIPPRRNRAVQREYGPDLDQARHLSEHCFGTLKQFRAIATRYEKIARTFLAAIHVAATASLLN